MVAIHHTVISCSRQAERYLMKGSLTSLWFCRQDINKAGYAGRPGVSCTVSEASASHAVGAADGLARENILI